MQSSDEQPRRFFCLATGLAGRLAAVGTGCAYGDVHLPLARIEHLLGDDAAAARHADAAVAVCDRAGEGPWLVRSLLFRAELTGDAADHDRAAAIVERLDLGLLRTRL